MTPAGPLYLSVAGRQVFAWWHPAREDAPPGSAVLVCPPFGWPEVSSYRERRAWAERLAAHGHPVLRLDLPGTGDSEGDPTDSELVATWVAALAGAARWVRQAVPGYRLTMAGLGSGGLLAWLAVAGGAPVEDLVLWATPSRGRTVVRELKALARLESAIAPPPDPRLDPPAGSLSVAGFLLTPDTLAALQAIDLTASPLPTRGGRRALLLGRDGRGPDADLAGLLRDDGAAVETASGAGWSAMALADEPQDAESPAETWTAIEDWLARAPGPIVLEPGPPVAATAIAELTVDGATIRETPLSFGPRFGVLAEPAAPARAVSVVLLNAGAVRRTGPNRLWVKLARRWAARGVPVLRFDLEGLGDSEGDGSRFADVLEMYDAALVDQVVAALDALHRRAPDTRVVLGGLCSGAYLAVRAALADDRVTTAMAINAWSLSFDPSLRLTRDVRRVLRDWRRPRTWPTIARRLRRGEISRTRMRELAGHAVRIRGRRPAEAEPSSAIRHAAEPVLDELQASGRHTLLVFSAGEPLLEELTAAGLRDPPTRWPGLTIATLPGHSHTFAPVQSQRRLTAVLDAAVEAAGRRAEPAGVSPSRDG